ncbi:MAG: hypothetical protein ACP5JG_06970 [Anaerolineae bacterium]
MSVSRWSGACSGLLAMLVAILTLGVGCEASTPEEVVPPTSTVTASLAPTATPSSTPSPTRPPTSTSHPTSTPTPTPRPRPTTPSPEQLATQYPELAAVLDNPEVSDAYKELVVAYQEGGEQGAIALAQQRGLLTPEGDVRATLLMDTSETAGTVTQLQSMGIKVLETQGNQIQVAIPQQLMMSGATQPGPALIQLANLDHVIGVQPPW